MNNATPHPVLDIINTEIRAQLRSMGLRHAQEGAGSRLVVVACDRKLFCVWAQPRVTA